MGPPKIKFQEYSEEDRKLRISARDRVVPMDLVDPEKFWSSRE